MLEPIKDYKYQDCIFKVDGPVATFMFSNPTARNSGTGLAYEGLYNAVATIKENDDIRVLVVTGDPEGRAFHSGLNVKRRATGLEAAQKGEAAGPSREEEEFTPGTPYYRVTRKGGGYHARFEGETVAGRYNAWQDTNLRGGYLVRRGSELLRLPKPVIAMVNGPAAGIGCDLAFHCDIIIASDQARFMWLYIHRGMAIPAEGAGYFLPRLCGYHRAMEILLKGSSLTAQEAYDWDLINHVVPHDQLESYTYDLARQLATESPPKHMGIVKWAAQRMYHDFAGQLEEYHETIVTAYNKILDGSNDAIEGSKAFVEKRKPQYTGT